MMTLLPLLILAIHPSGPTEVDALASETVFYCPFGESWDENFDEWPDGWTRQTGSGFPHYVGIKISEEPSPVGNRCLRINLDGGGAAAYSPLIDVSWLYGYLLVAQMKTENLVHDRAFVSVTLLDWKRRQLATYSTEGINHTDGWTSVRLGPLEPGDKDVTYAIIGVHVEPGEREDLKGAAVFDDIRLVRLPRVLLSTERGSNVFLDPSQIEIACHASGFVEKQPRVAFRLEDVDGRELAQAEQSLTVRRATIGATRQTDESSDASNVQLGTALWKPRVPGPGFYRVSAELTGTATPSSGRLALVVIEPNEPSSGGEFGWSIPRGDRAAPLGELEALVAHAGVGWLKYPIWYGQEASEDELSSLIRFSERLSSRSITLVGLLDAPPPELRDRFTGSGRFGAAEIFAGEFSAWWPSFEAMLARLSNRVSWWQIGREGDTSFVGCAALNEKLGRIESAMDRLVQNVQLGTAWSMTAPPPRDADGNPCSQFLAVLSKAESSPEEMADYLARSRARQSGPDAIDTVEPLRWVTIEPLSRERAPVDRRAADLAHRMLAAKIAGADVIFASDPFDPDHGLLNVDGTPSELFLPWRTSALALGGGRHLGRVELPGGSTNEVFARETDAVMVVWNERPCTEMVYVGDGASQVDLWGRRTALSRDGHRQVISVGPAPTFVVEMNESIAQWRRASQWSTAVIPSVPGRPHPCSLCVTNTFPVAAGVRATLVLPDGWRAEPRQSVYTLSPKASHTQEFTIALPYDVNNGDYLVHVEFEVHADQPYRFSVHQRLEVGVEGVKVEYSTAVNAQGQLAVSQRLLNTSDTAVSFRCQLIAPGRPRQEVVVANLPPGSQEHTYLLDDGAALIGKTLWIRAEELGGDRKLNYRFVVEK